jgi:hypothetical protein
MFGGQATITQRRIAGWTALTTLSLAIRSDSNGDVDRRAFFDIHKEYVFLGNSTITISKRVENCDPFLIPLSDIVLCDDSKVAISSNYQ